MGPNISTRRRRGTCTRQGWRHGSTTSLSRLINRLWLCKGKTGYLVMFSPETAVFCDQDLYWVHMAKGSVSIVASNLQFESVSPVKRQHMTIAVKLKWRPVCWVPAHSVLRLPRNACLRSWVVAKIRARSIVARTLQPAVTDPYPSRAAICQLHGVDRETLRRDDGVVKRVLGREVRAAWADRRARVLAVGVWTRVGLAHPGTTHFGCSEHCHARSFAARAATRSVRRVENSIAFEHGRRFNKCIGEKLCGQRSRI